MGYSVDTFDNSYQHRGTECPTCQKVLDASTGGKDAPSKGDLSICAYCGEILVYQDNIKLNLEIISPEELDNLAINSIDTYIKILSYQKLIRNTSIFNQHKQ